MSAPAATSRPSSPYRLGRGWVRGPIWDGFWILNALWLAALVWVLGRGHADPASSPIDDVYLVLNVLFWVGHRFSSAYLAYFTSAYRPLLRTQRTRFVRVPIAIALLCFAVLLPPDDALPFTRMQRVMYLAILDYALVTYHFAAQHYGVLSLYRVRAGQKRGLWARRADRLFALGVGGVLVIAAEVIGLNAVFQEEWLGPVLSASWIGTAHDVVQVLGTILVAAAALGMLVLETRQAKPSIPRALYIAGTALLVITAFHANIFVFLVLWTSQHWMVAVGLATRVARADPEPGPSWWYRLWHVVNRHAWAVLLVLVFVSAVLLPVMEVEAVDQEESLYGDRIAPAFSDWLRSSWLVPVLLALGFTTGFVHYVLDRAVYRFSDPEVRRAAHGLLE